MKVRFNFVSILVLTFGIILLCYSGYKSYYLSFTHDECITYLKIIHGTFYEIISNDSSFVSANNHILNSLCMKYFEMLFGSSEFVLRLHSLIAHLLYIIFTYLLLARNIKTKWIQLVGFIFLNFNPLLLDFFSLARGYALSIAFMVVSIYYLIEFTKKETQKYMHISLTMAILATLANFSMITFTASLILLFEYFIVIKKYPLKQYIIRNIPILIATIILFYLYKEPISRLVANQELYFGGKDGLWNDTVLSSIAFYLHYSDYGSVSAVFMKILLLVAIFTSTLLMINKIKQKTIRDLDYVFLISVLIVSMHFIQHYVMNTNFYIERAALFLVVLFFIILTNLIDYFWQFNLIIKITNAILVLSMFIIMALVNYDILKNPYVFSWQYDSDTKNMLIDLAKENITKKEITIGVTWLYEPSINFYRQTKSLTWIKPVTREGLAGDYSFFFVHLGDLNTFNKSNKKFIKNYPISEVSLFKKIE